MLDFLKVTTRVKKPGFIEVFPTFLIKKSEDLMIRGGDFYAVWVEDRGLWSTDENDVVQLVDRELTRYAEENKEKIEGSVTVAYMWDAGSGSIDAWHKYCQKQIRDSYSQLDEKLVFANDGINKKDYASKRLPYPLEDGNCPAYEKIISTLYTPEERHKLEWAIGAIVSGDSKSLQKFLVLYGGPGTGKSTILNIVQDLFEGYHTVFDAKALGSANAQFALEPFKDNPLVAIQHDGDLSKIEDNTRLNSVVSHELMTVNEKHKAMYKNRFICFLFMGTNKPVKITDGKSGILRRLIDVSPSGNKIPPREYKKLIQQVKFELGPIAYHCREVFLANPGAYDEYVPTGMMGASNDFYNFMIDSYHVFRKEDGTSLKAAWEMYKTYVEEAKVPYGLSKMNFKAELANYFREFSERFVTGEGERVRSYYSGFRTDKFMAEESRPSVVESVGSVVAEPVAEFAVPDWLKMDAKTSIFDVECADCLAQKANSKETPARKWDDVTGTLSRMNTSILHYVKVPDNHIVIDFDIKDETGKKSHQKNLEAASKWPPTYAELSKSGAGIHLHYIYNGDVTKLSRIYEDDIEIKVFTGKSSLRRMLTKCNDQPIATISSGLPLKGDDKLVNWDGIKNERMLRTMIKRNLAKEYWGATKPSVDYIAKLLDEAYKSGIGYDVTDMRNDIFAFAASSTNQAPLCIKLVNQMKFKSEEPNEDVEAEGDELVFYDIEIFPNLFIVCWKAAGRDKPVVQMINPKPSEIEALLRFKLVGFNVRKYDNHLLYSRLMGYDNEQMYNLSQKIINNQPGAFFREAYNLSYTDIYDFASAGNKKSLKKLEIEMSTKANDPTTKMDDDLRAMLKTIKHQELGLPWDKPVPEELWQKVADYCINDVVATEAAFYYLTADFTAREILADLAGSTVNDTTNSLTAKIVFGNNRKPQGEFCYRDMSKPVYELDDEVRAFLEEACPEMMAQRHGEAQSLLPYFPGYTFEYGKSIYRGEEIGEGGRVYFEPGIYTDVALLDIASQHPHSIIAECFFGPRYTRRFRDLVVGRVSIKHKDWDATKTILDGKLVPHVQRIHDGEITSKDLANAIKTPVNSAYGVTAASFENPFRDPRNVDNLVAKRGALFMTDLKHELQKRGFTVAHIKTDSVKVPNATPEIIQFVMDFGKQYGYTFEHEATYDRMCLVNGSTYIAKYADPEWCEKKYGYIPGDNADAKKKNAWWTATAKQFQVPYVFKTLFSKEPIVFEDLCQTFEVKTAIYVDMNECMPDVSAYEAELAKLQKDIRDPKSKLNRSDNYDTDLHRTMARIRELEGLIKDGHDYNFVGKVGNFCPIVPGKGGGVLARQTNAADGEIKFTSVTGTLKPDKTPYRWLEADAVKALDKKGDIDKSYYRRLVDDAVEAISQYGDFERFVADEPYAVDDPAKLDFPPDDDLPYYIGPELATMLEKPLDDAHRPPWCTDEEWEAMKCNPPKTYADLLAEDQDLIGESFNRR